MTPATVTRPGMSHALAYTRIERRLYDLLTRHFVERSIEECKKHKRSKDFWILDECKILVA